MPKSYLHLLLLIIRLEKEFALKQGSTETLSSRLVHVDLDLHLGCVHIAHLTAMHQAGPPPGIRSGMTHAEMPTTRREGPGTVRMYWRGGAVRDG